MRKLKNEELTKNKWYNTDLRFVIYTVILLIALIIILGNYSNALNEPTVSYEKYDKTSYEEVITKVRVPQTYTIQCNTTIDLLKGSNCRVLSQNVISFDKSSLTFWGTKAEYRKVQVQTNQLINNKSIIVIDNIKCSGDTWGSCYYIDNLIKCENRHGSNNDGVFQSGEEWTTINPNNISQTTKDVYSSIKEMGVKCVKQ